MDELFLCDGTNDVPRCMKHNRHWQARVQELLNKLRDKHIKQIYIPRFNKLLCTCEGLGYANLWEEVTDEQLNATVSFIDDYIANHTTSDLVKVLSDIMNRLRWDGELYNIGYDAPSPFPFPRSSAAKLCYLLQKVIEKDFKMMEPKKPAGVAQGRAKQKETKCTAIELEGIDPAFIPILIGSGGRTVMKFMRREKCRVEIKTVNGIVKAIITKSILREQMAVLEQIGERLKEYAEQVKKDEEDMETEGQVTSDQAVAGPSGGTSDSVNATGSSENYNTITIPKSVLAEGAVSTVPNESVESNIRSETGAVGGAVDSTRVGGNSDPCPTSCLVHDRRWVSTYQYVLTQCYQHIDLPRSMGSRFSRLVCTCRSDRPEARMYFLKEDDMVAGFEKCKKALLHWPHECQMIIKPLVDQLEKYDRSDIWHSLFKFVYYFHGISGGNLDMMNFDYKLPGHNSNFVPRRERAYLYQAPVKPSGLSQSTSVESCLNTATGASSRTGTNLESVSLYSRLATVGSLIDELTPGQRADFDSILQTRAAAQNLPHSAYIPNPVPRPKRVRPEDWSEDCYLHGTKKKAIFQYTVNCLLARDFLPKDLNHAFCVAVCICTETADRREYYMSDGELRLAAQKMRNKLEAWSGASKSSIRPLIQSLEANMDDGSCTPGLLRFIYYFNQVEGQRLDSLANLQKEMK